MDRKINRIYLSVFWLILTVSLGIWWFYLGLRQANTISDLTIAMGSPYSDLGNSLLQKQSRMIWMEGTFFIVMLSLGGSLLIWFTYRDIQRNNLIQDFFSTVTHEMKTPLAGLRLQVEGLLDDLGETSEYSYVLKRAVKESDRIESQMEKAFYLASIMRSESLFLERTNIGEMKFALEESYPQVDWEIKEDIDWLADKKALESILKNLIENSYKHGIATKVTVSVKSEGGKVCLFVDDNGQGFHGNMKDLGKPFQRHSSTSGTGIGIYIINGLIKKMNASIQFRSDEIGFHVKISLPIWREKN
ncbi:MAG: HAMP domain-containing histidine kinase [Leptospira sp.]|nr:HAMP domain-containing histidine kinase [Leptospira sp.]